MIIAPIALTAASLALPAAAFLPCAEPPPPGMRCVAGGAASVGNDAGAANERPRRDIELSTFYVDEKRATVADLRACVAAGACPGAVAAGVARDEKRHADHDDAALDHDGANKLCGFLGKRLLTEWEWEKAAPAPGALAEWTASWAGENFAAPCTQCSGLDPTGICSSTDPCSRGGAKKVVRGGPKAKSASARFAEAATARRAVRCASTSTRLWGFPTLQGTEARPAPPPLAPPPEAQRKAAHDVVEDKLDKQECAKQGRSFIDCRDPSSYIKTNEPRQSLWIPYIRNLGGGYTGVGIDQNYSLMAVQKAEWGWLFDYDPVVVRLHWALRAIILDSADRASFIAHFDEKARDATLKLIDDAYAGNPERAAYREVYAVSRKSLRGYYEKQTKGERDDPSYGWLATEDAYQYVRLLFQQDRVVIMKGDMLADKAMQSIGNAARAAGVVIRVYYPSNAPEFWPHSEQYKANVIGLPFDEKSVVLQTFSGLKPGFLPKRGYWHYNVEAGLLQQELMRRRGVGSLPQLVTVRNKTDDSDLTVTGLARAQ